MSVPRLGQDFFLNNSTENSHKCLGVAQLVAKTHRSWSSSGQSPRCNDVSLSAVTSVCPARVPATYTQLRKLQNLQIEVVLWKSHTAAPRFACGCFPNSLRVWFKQKIVQAASSNWHKIKIIKRWFVLEMMMASSRQCKGLQGGGDQQVTDRPTGRAIELLGADSHYTSHFRSVAERLRQASVPFRPRPRARMFDATERVRTGLNLLDSDNVNSNYVTSTTLRVFACNEGCL
jgi:hypothetical protein